MSDPEVNPLTEKECQLAVVSCALLLCAAVLNVAWWAGPSQMW